MASVEKAKRKRARHKNVGTRQEVAPVRLTGAKVARATRGDEERARLRLLEQGHWRVIGVQVLVLRAGAVVQVSAERGVLVVHGQWHLVVVVVVVLLLMLVLVPRVSGHRLLRVLLATVRPAHRVLL